MPTFEDSRLALRAARRAVDEARDSLSASVQHGRQGERALARDERTFDATRAEDVARRQELTRQIEAARSRRVQEQAKLRDLLAQQQAALDAFAPDPRQQLGELDDTLPLFLLPLRIEARFIPRAGTSELLVRVFPDDWAVSAFEPQLSEQEIAHAGTFWMHWWAAGGHRGDRLAAWRSLVSSHGSGRAAWIVEQFRPVQPAAEPSRGERELLLVVAVHGLPPEPVRTAAQDYWAARWRNDGDPHKAAWNALVAAVSEPLATSVADELVPGNVTDVPPLPLGRADVSVRLVWLDLPDPSTFQRRVDSWTRPARTRLLPERLVLVLRRGTSDRELLGEPISPSLALGPNPDAPADEQIRRGDGEIRVPDDLAWMFDFDRAVAQGLGFRVALSAEEAREGFDRVLVVGVNLRDDSAETQALVEELFDHHHHSAKGFALVPQGTPTNNTERRESGYTYRDDVEDSYRRYFEDPPRLDAPAIDDKLDGQWLCEWLGISTRVVERVAHAAGRDQREARSINTLLWPATLGYTMDAMLGEVFDEDVRLHGRELFRHFVVPRGVVPSIVIGDQPYGILPTTAWSQLEWVARTSVWTDVPSPVRGFSDFDRTGFLDGCYELLKKIDVDWTTLVASVPHVGRAGDSHQVLLDVLGLHPASVEFHHRYSNSTDYYYNLLNLQGYALAFLGWRDTLRYVESGMTLLRRLGYTGAETPALLERLFHGAQHRLQGPLIDDVEPSEQAGIRAYTDDGRNYLRWLHDAAMSSLDALRNQEDFTGDRPPEALLYLLVRHALQLGYWETGLKFHASAPTPAMSPDELRAARKEPTFVHVGAATQVSESRYRHLYQPLPSVTGDQLLVTHVANVLAQAPEARAMREQLDALERLIDTPTARLERLLVEHLDACSYRLDAWKSALVNYQLSAMRFAGRQGREPRQGLYVGAYGWLEDLRPRLGRLTRADLSADLRDSFGFGQEAPWLDSDNRGFIHAPSLNQAVTAAVLRNGHLSNQTAEVQRALAVDLSSNRVRRALAVIEGVRNDQSLDALLGYQLERALHDDYQLAETDVFIFALRKAFPLVANRLRSTEGPLAADDRIAAIEARNVLDGLRLSRHVANTGRTSYPFDLPDMPDATDEQRDKIDAAVRDMRLTHDAVADLAIAESLHQAMKGNVAHAAATLDAYGKAEMPPLPDIISTPREGLAVTQRFGVLLDTAATADPRWAAVPLTPRGAAEPSLNAWLASLLPPPSQIACLARRLDTMDVVEVSVEALALQPLDLLYVVRLDAAQVSSELDDRVESYVRGAVPLLRPSHRVELLYPAEIPGKVTLFELAPMLQSLRRLVVGSRPLRASDFSPQTEANTAQHEDELLERGRAEAALDGLRALQVGLNTYVGELQTALADPLSDREALLAGLEGRLSAYSSHAAALAPFGAVEADLGFTHETKAQFFRGLDRRLAALVADWDRRAREFNGQLVRYDVMPTAAPAGDRLKALQRCERLVSTHVTAPLPSDPANYRTIVVAHKAAFDARLAQLQQLSVLATTEPFAYFEAVRALLPLTHFVSEPFSVAEEEERLVGVTRELLQRAMAMRDVVNARVAAAEAALAAHTAAATEVLATAALERAFQGMFGEDFRPVTSFQLPADQAIELRKVHDQREALTRYLRVDLARPLPLDDWLCSLARVREKLADWEYVTVATEGFTRAEPGLVPWQLPFVKDDYWLAADYPATHNIHGDRLLVTMHHAVPFAESARQAGLLVDEWTEVIPSTQVTTGVAFHFDRPNSEPPQAMLLVTPTQFRGGWRWSDVIGAVSETLDMAKQRAVEPEQIDRTAYGRLLPATSAATTQAPVTIGMNFALVNGARRDLEG